MSEWGDADCLSPSVRYGELNETAPLESNCCIILCYHCSISYIINGNVYALFTFNRPLSASYVEIEPITLLAG